MCMGNYNGGLRDVALRDEIQRSTVRLAVLAEEAGMDPLSGIFYTVAGVIEGELDENFAGLCNDFIEAFRKAHKEANMFVDPKKFN
jgi:hypothetical protein